MSTAAARADGRRSTVGCEFRTVSGTMQSGGMRPRRTRYSASWRVMIRGISWHSVDATLPSLFRFCIIILTEQVNITSSLASGFVTPAESGVFSPDPTPDKSERCSAESGMARF